MRKLKLLAGFVLVVLTLKGQTYPSVNISLVGHIAPNLAAATVNKYSGCWGWYQASKNKEYAISGTSNGVYFIDITVPSTPSVCAFVGGRNNSVWREMKTYGHYCYIVSDDSPPNRFQIVDLQYLPDSVVLIKDDNALFERGHTIWIDKDNMYIGICTFSNTMSQPTQPLAIFSLATPTAPVLKRGLYQDVSSNVIAQIHDMYVLNDTIYASAGWQGLWIYRYKTNPDTILTLGQYTGYPDAGYNHSSFLTADRKHLIFCDEVPAAKPIHFVNVQNFSNIQPVQTFKAAPGTTAHNPYIIGNKWAIVSCYQDGLYIYDISKPDTIKLAGYFDTFPQGGVNTGSYGNSSYAGNWGAYPWLPSGIIIANDMQNGVFLLDASVAFNTPSQNPVHVNGLTSAPEIIFFPNPATDRIYWQYSGETGATLEIKNILGQSLHKEDIQTAGLASTDISQLPSGTYNLVITSGKQNAHKKFIIQH
jgi:choice-of-anchor B domain-containing protein